MRGSLRERSVVTESHGREQYERVGRGLLSVQRHDDQATQQENEGVTSNQSCRQARLCFSSYILRSRRSCLWALWHIICVQERAAFTNFPGPQHKFSGKIVNFFVSSGGLA